MRRGRWRCRGLRGRRGLLGRWKGRRLQGRNSSVGEIVSVLFGREGGWRGKAYLCSSTDSDVEDRKAW